MKSTPTIENHVLHFKTFLQKQFSLSEQEWDIVKEYWQQEAFPRNEYFVSQGKICRKLAFIAEGVIRFCMFRDDGTDVTCFLMCENDFAGDPESFFSQKPSDKNVQALTDCHLLTISYDNMQKLLHRLIRGDEINAAIDHYVMMKMLFQRTFLLNLDATVRYNEFIREYAHILQRIPLSYIANFLGITQQSLSRLRRQMPVSPKKDIKKSR